MIFQLDVYIDKDESLRSGEWEKLLNENQQIYAAVDVYVSNIHLIHYYRQQNQPFHVKSFYTGVSVDLPEDKGG